MGFENALSGEDVIKTFMEVSIEVKHISIGGNHNEQMISIDDDQSSLRFRKQKYHYTTF